MKKLIALMMLFGFTLYGAVGFVVDKEEGIVSVPNVATTAQLALKANAEGDNLSANFASNGGLSTTSDLAQVEADVSTLAGEISNSYVMVDDLRLNYDASYSGTRYTNNVVSEEEMDVMLKSWNGWAFSLAATHEYESWYNPSMSARPPETGWVNADDETPATLSVEFHSGKYIGSENIETGTVSGTAGKLPDSQSVKGALELKASNTGLVERTVTITNKITIVGNGQSNMEGYPTSYGMLPGEALSGIENCYFVHRGQQATTVTNTWDYLGELKMINVRTNTWTGAGDLVVWSVELPLCKSLRDQMPDTEFYFVKAPVGGSGIYNFLNGALYWPYITNAWEAAQAAWTNPPPKYEIWMQGEAESASESGSASYYTNQVQIIADHREYYGNPDMVVILPGLPASFYDDAYGPVVEQAKIDCAANLTNVYYIKMWDIPEITSHYSESNIFIVASRLSDLIFSLESGRDYEDPISTKRITAESGDVAGAFNAQTLLQKGVPVDEIVSKAVVNYSLPSKIQTQSLSEGAVVRFNYYDHTQVGFTTNSLITDSPTIAFESGKIGGYLQVRDEADVVALPNDTIQWTNNNFTIFFRIRPQYNAFNGSNFTHIAWGGRQGTTSNYASYITSRSPYTSDKCLRQKLRMYPETGSGEDFMLFHALESNVWSSIAFTVNRTTKEVVGYFDGIEDTAWIGTSTNEWTSNILNASKYTAIGGSYDSTSTGFSECDYDDVVVLPRVLTAEEIWWLHQGQTVDGEEL